MDNLLSFNLSKGKPSMPRCNVSSIYDLTYVLEGYYGIIEA